MDDAIVQYRQALDIFPEYAEAHSNLGNALRSDGRFDEAIEQFERAIKINPNAAIAHCNLGVVYDEKGRPKEAVDSYRRALALDANYAEAHNNLGNALDELGEQDDAIVHYRRALAARPTYAEALRNLTRIAPDDEQLPQLHQLLGEPGISASDKTHCQFALGNVYHSAGNFDLAFEHYHAGNTLKRQVTDYNADHYSAYVDRLIATYSKEYFASHRQTSAGSDLPVFIVGMPRSGTTLVEQIISSHPKVYGAGELATFGMFEQEIARRFAPDHNYPESITLCSDQDLHDFASRYVDELRHHSADAQRVSDKMPSNFARVGLIKAAFPEARIIHCQRNPLDTCISNYLHYFAVGNEYSFDLQDLGRYYLDYERLMAHWRELFPGEVLEIRYEDLVADQEAVSREMIDYIGLKWDRRCLKFYRNQRAVNTFNSKQVRQPIYNTAVNRWKRYEATSGAAY